MIAGRFSDATVVEYAYHFFPTLSSASHSLLPARPPESASTPFLRRLMLGSTLSGPSMISYLLHVRPPSSLREARKFQLLPTR